VKWRSVLPRTKLQAHTRHFFEREISDPGIVSHLRFNIYPDGGVSRLRVYGSLAWTPRHRARISVGSSAFRRVLSLVLKPA